jgi:hypothetical protein
MIRGPNFSYRTISHTTSRGYVQLFLFAAGERSGDHNAQLRAPNQLKRMRGACCFRLVDEPKRSPIASRRKH